MENKEDVGEDSETSTVTVSDDEMPEIEKIIDRICEKDSAE